MDFFDGATADSSGGASVYIWINEHHHLSIKLRCGRSTNTRVEGLALWALLYVSKEIGLPYLHVFGDSSVIINWANDLSSLTIMSLEAWCINIRKLIVSFSAIDFKYFYREHNERADTLSKEGLILAPSQLTFTDYCEGLVTEEASLQLF